MTPQSQRVEAVIEEVRRIREAINKLSTVEDSAMLTAMGIYVAESETDSELDSDPGDLTEPSNVPSISQEAFMPRAQPLLLMI